MTAVESEKPKSTARAGRNLPAAIAVGVVLGGLAILSMVFWHPGIAVIAIAGSFLALIELARAFAKANIQTALVLLLLGGVGMQIAAWAWGITALLSAYGLTLFALLLWHGVLSSGTQKVTDLAGSVLSLTYVPFLASFAVLMAIKEPTAYPLAIYIGGTVASDTGGYALGVLFGKHPIAPSISPKKSWEGLSGSVLGACAVSLGFFYPAGLTWWQGLILGILIALVALIGDLCESLLKRDLGIKDMGDILPGHGGVMDRFDSLLIVAPMCFVFFNIWGV